MNPIKRFFEAYKHGSDVQRSRRLQREAQAAAPTPSRLEANRTVDIKGVGVLTSDEINFELERGAKFVVFPYCISALIVTY